MLDGVFTDVLGDTGALIEDVLAETERLRATCRNLNELVDDLREQHSDDAILSNLWRVRRNLTVAGRRHLRDAWTTLDTAFEPIDTELLRRRDQFLDRCAAGVPVLAGADDRVFFVDMQTVPPAVLAWLALCTGPVLGNSLFLRVPSGLQSRLRGAGGLGIADLDVIRDGDTDDVLGLAAEMHRVAEADSGLRSPDVALHTARAFG